LRVNLGAAFRELFKGEEGGINVVLKLYGGVFKVFYKDDKQSLFPICKSAKYADGWRYCSKCQCFYHKNCPIHDIRNSPRKKKKGNNSNSLYKPKMDGVSAAISKHPLKDVRDAQIMNTLRTSIRRATTEVVAL
jgi:hypothetical protein